MFSRLNNKKYFTGFCGLVAVLAMTACGGGGGGGSGTNNGSSSSSSSSSTTSTSTSTSTSSSSSSTSTSTSTSSSSSSSSSSSGVVVQRSPDWLVFTADKDVDEFFELYATLDDGSIDPIKLSIYSESIKVGSFYVSPDGEYVAFLARKDVDDDGSFQGPFELYRVPTDRQQLATKISGTLNSYSYIDAVSWSPQSNQLVFRANIDAEDTREIYLVDNSSTTPVKINGNTAGIVEMGDTHWSPDGRYLAQFVLNKTRRYIMDRRAINIYDTTLGEPNSTRVTGNLVPGSTYDAVNGWGGANISHLRWAPDSSRIVYMLDDHRTGDQRTYWQAFPDGTNENVTGTLAGTENGGLTYEWSSDSRYLAYEVVTDGLGSNIIEIFDTEDNSHHRVVTAPNGGRTSRVSWRPNSDQFVLSMSSVTNGLFELFIFNAEDNNVVNPIPLVALNEDEAINYNISWSRSGERLAVNIDNSDTSTYSIYTINPDLETTPVQLTEVLSGDGESDYFTWLANDDSLMIGHASGHYIASANLSDSAQRVSASLDVNVEVYSSYFRPIGSPSPNFRVDTEGTVAFLANVPVDGNVGLYTTYEDGTMLTEVAGAMVEGGNVNQFKYAKMSE